MPVGHFTSIGYWKCQFKFKSLNSHAFSILPKVTRPDGKYETVVHLPLLRAEEAHQQAWTSLWNSHEEVRSRARMFLSLVFANLS